MYHPHKFPGPSDLYCILPAIHILFYLSEHPILLTSNAYNIISYFFPIMYTNKGENSYITVQTLLFPDDQCLSRNVAYRNHVLIS